MSAPSASAASLTEALLVTDGRARADRSWWSWAGPQGGFVAGLCLNASLPLLGASRVPRSLHALFLEPATEGDLELGATLVREGGSSAVVAVTAGDAARASVVGGRARGTSTLPAEAAPDVPGPDACADTPLPVDFVPFSQHLQWRFATPARPFEAGPRPELVAWVRPVVDVPIDHAALVVLVDATPPAVYAVASAPLAVPTVDLTVSFTDAPAASGWVLCASPRCRPRAAGASTTARCVTPTAASSPAAARRADCSAIWREHADGDHRCTRHGALRRGATARAPARCRPRGAPGRPQLFRGSRRRRRRQRRPPLARDLPDPRPPTHHPPRRHPMTNPRTTPVALVTGATSGIGAATASALVDAGYDVVGTGRRTSGLTPPPGVRLVDLDVLDDAAVTSLADNLVERHGRLDLLVNNAGSGTLGAVEELSIAEAQRVFDVNVWGVVRTTKAALPHMRSQGRGRVVNVSSVLGFLPAPFSAAYAAAKHAVEGYSESLDHEVREHGVRVVLVEPAYTRTGFEQSQARPETSLPAYVERRRVADEVMATSVENGDDPTVVARVVVRAARARNPRGRYTAGRTAAQVTVARRLAPAAVLDAQIRKLNRLPR